MRLINLIIGLAILFFFIALLYVGYNAISYYNANASTAGANTSHLSAAAAKTTEAVKDLGATAKESLEEAKALANEVFRDTINNTSNNNTSDTEGAGNEEIADEASDETLEQETEEEASIDEVSKEENQQPTDESLVSQKSSNEVPKRPAAYEQAKRKTSSAPAKVYAIVAGSFSSRANAKVERQRLQKLGYQAEIVQFSRSPYHSLVAKRVATAAAAKATIKALKAKGIEAFSRKLK